MGLNPTEKNQKVTQQYSETIRASLENGTMCLIPPPPVNLVSNQPQTQKDILYSNKNISLIREHYMHVNTWRIVSTTVWTLQVKKIPLFFDIVQSSRNSRWNKLKLYEKAPILTEIFSVISRVSTHTNV